MNQLRDFLARFESELVNILGSPFCTLALSALGKDFISHNGCSIHIGHKMFSQRIKGLLLLGLYEKAEVSFIKKYLRADLDVVELGSGLGVTTSHIAKRLNHRRRMIVVEADPRLIPQIRRNVVRNAPSVNLILINKAVCYSTEMEDEVVFGAASYFLESRVLSDSKLVSDAVLVPKISLSEILSSHDVDEYALVCDIEGAEIGLLLEDQSALATCQQLVIEIHESTHNGRHYQVSEIFDFLVSELGFSLCDRRNKVMVFTK